ncbi:hypothetical protein F4859DRAFT_489445 [Xylaria cf. heliscus]|nr:hypothetical protein F4859DRAFT_489445 [Xylaria cf. heliscus]
MAYSGSNPAQNYYPNPLHIYNPMQDESNIYDLDDPYLISKILDQHPQYPSVPADSITCRFTAFPMNEPGAFSPSLEHYGHVVHESRDKLILRLPAGRLNFLDRVRQVWVSKYMAPYPFAECRITFDLPRGDGSMLVIVQRVLPRLPYSSAVDGGQFHNVSGDMATHGARRVGLPSNYGARRM